MHINCLLSISRINDCDCSGFGWNRIIRENLDACQGQWTDNIAVFLSRMHGGLICITFCLSVT